MRHCAEFCHPWFNDEPSWEVCLSNCRKENERVGTPIYKSCPDQYPDHLCYEIAKGRYPAEPPESYVPLDPFGPPPEMELEPVWLEPTPAYDVKQVGEGVKFDDGKDPWHLAPWDAFRAIVKVLAFGAKKYADRNWEKGMAWSRPYAALQRHMTAWWQGEDKDPETGMSHLWHAGCCVIFLIAYEMRGNGTDDRPNTLPIVTISEEGTLTSSAGFIEWTD